MRMYHRWILLVTQSFLHWLGVAVFCFVCVMFVSTLTWKVVIAAASMESFWQKSFHHTTLQSMLVENSKRWRVIEIWIGEIFYPPGNQHNNRTPTIWRFTISYWNCWFSIAMFVSITRRLGWTRELQCVSLMSIPIWFTTIKEKQARWFKVTFYPLGGGHLTFPKGHLTIPKRSQRTARSVISSSHLFQQIYLCFSQCFGLSGSG